MAGFIFSKSELQKTQIRHSEVSQDSNCLQCGLYKKCQNPKMPASGEGKAGVHVLAEACGPDEDAKGTQLIGRTGQFFRERVRELGFDLDKHFTKHNAVNCWPQEGGKTRKPTGEEIALCRPMVYKTIEQINPTNIWAMGGPAVQSLYSEFFQKNDLKISNLEAFTIPDWRFNCWVSFLFHPSYIIRNERDANMQAWYRKSLQAAMDMTGRPLPEKLNTTDKIHSVTSYDDILSLLNSLIDDPPLFLYFDYETTGLKPFRPGHKILSISLCPIYKGYEMESYGFPYQWKDHFSPHQKSEIANRFKHLLQRKQTGKQAHNIQYEDVWSRTIFGAEIVNWDWCSLMGARIENNRRKYSSLTMQCFLKFGILPYDTEINPYKKAKPGSEFNRLEEIPLTDLLEYNNFDTFYGSRLVDPQKQHIKDNPSKQFPYRLFHEGTLNLGEMQYNGIPIVEEYYLETGKEIDKKIAEAEKRVVEGHEAELFKQRTGRPLKIKKDISNADLRELFEAMNLPRLKETESGLLAVDEDVLNQYALIYGVEIAKRIIDRRKLAKIRGTYLGQFEREACNGFVHPMIGLAVPVTYRSSCEKPNFHNIPKRDEDAKKYTRKGIKARKGYCIMEPDFSGVEVSVSACYHRDPNMINYIMAPGTDMHRDSAADAWMLPHQEIAKLVRFFAKNCWVFPQFYGSWYQECARNLWKECVQMRQLETVSGIPLAEHLKTKGIQGLDDFTEHCKEVENIFWYQRFNTYRVWKEQVNALYRDKGFIESLMGFVYQGYMSFREVANYPIQGTAFHILLWTLNRVMRIAKEEGWKSRFINEIHDSMVLEAAMEEKDHIIRTIKRVGEVETQKRFPWLVVPLRIDFEVSPEAATWYEAEEIKLAA